MLGTSVVAKRPLEVFYRSLDPFNRFNPGIGQGPVRLHNVTAAHASITHVARIAAPSTARNRAPTRSSSLHRRLTTAPCRTPSLAMLDTQSPHVDRFRFRLS